MSSLDWPARIVAVDPIGEIYDRLIRRGGADYGGEAVTQLQHALQCATLAESGGAEAPLISAALLHDIGHLLYDPGEAPADRGFDDRHEARGCRWLSRWFDGEVAGPVRLHVDAKRYLTATDSTYFQALSPASVRSLALQGGAFSAERAARFIDLPHAPAAVRLRQWDDAAKVPGRTTPDLAYFRNYLSACLRAG